MTNALVAPTPAPVPPGGNGAPAPNVLVQGVCHYFGEGDIRQQVLFDNHLEVLPGEMVFMTGPSGSGKTTLLTLIGGLRAVQEGSLQVLGQEMCGRSDADLVDLRKGIGFIFQHHNLFDSLTALENVRMALELRPMPAAERNQQAAAILVQLGLQERLNYKPNKLSGGQRQRVAIARAMVHQPRLVLADEPTAALDEESAINVMRLLKQDAQRNGASVLIVTHDNKTLKFADRIVSMKGGKIVSNVVTAESVMICEFLKRVSLFEHMTPTQLAEVADKMSREKFEQGAVIIQQGAEGDKFYVIREGVAEVYIDDDQNVRQFRRDMTQGEAFGEMALLKNERRGATVIAKTPIVAYSLGKEDFQAAVSSSESFKEQLWKVYFQRQ